MAYPTNMPLWGDLLVFLAAAAAITVVGVRMSRIADRLADVTGLGEAVTGAVFLGASTSLSGIVTSVSAAYFGHPQLAVSNAIGGIAAQTLFIALADFAYRRANLEHAAASATNLISGTMLVLLLTIPLLAQLSPAVTVFSIHPATPLLVATYLFGLRLASRTENQPMWGPRLTSETKQDVPDEEPGDARTLWPLLRSFLVLAILIAIAGYAIAQAGLAIAAKTHIGEAIVGTLLTAVATSTPELVTTFAAVRRGALTLAVGGILGGNAFDVLFVAFADVAYRDGSIYHAITDRQLFVVAMSIAMTAVLLLGLLRREKHGIGNIGFESAGLILIYIGGMAVLAGS